VEIASFNQIATLPVGFYHKIIFKTVIHQCFWQEKYVSDKKQTKKWPKQRHLISVSPMRRFDSVSVYSLHTTWISYNNNR